MTGDGKAHDIAHELGSLATAVGTLNRRMVSLENEVRLLTAQVNKWKGAGALAFIVGGALIGGIGWFSAWLRG